jgi:glycosyltransferase involved in cell wall biosynthesis
MQNNLEIIHIAPLVAPLGASAPGGAEQFTSKLAQYQSDKGLNVSVIALRGSKLPAGVKFIDLELADGNIFPLPLAPSDIGFDLALRRKGEAKVFTKVRKYLTAHSQTAAHPIVIHNHCYDEYPMFELPSLGLPMVHTLHLPPNFNWISDRLTGVKGSTLNSKFVTVSKCMQKLYLSKTGFEPDLIYNGMDFSLCPVEIEGSGDFLFVSRLSAEKGLKTAVEAVGEFGKARLRVVGRVYDREYFEREASQLLKNPWVDYLGPLEHSKVLIEMSRASALLMPIEWEEPFGLVALEALGCGTPVIANRRGALSEILKHEETGFLVDNFEQMLCSMRKIAQIDRRVCAAAVRERFDISKTAGSYLEFYRKLCN